MSSIYCLNFYYNVFGDNDLGLSSKIPTLLDPDLLDIGLYSLISTKFGHICPNLSCIWLACAKFCAILDCVKYSLF